MTLALALAVGFAVTAMLRLGWLDPRAALALAAAALLLGLFAGLTLPDLDQPLPLDHRSAVTHSAAPALLIAIRRWAWPLAAGIALGVGFHLSADLFPNAMIGFATVKMPFGGSIGATPSYAWLGANALFCLALGGWLLREKFGDGLLARLLLAAAVVAGCLYLFTVDGGWPALALFLAAGWFALARRRGAAPGAATGGEEQNGGLVALATTRSPRAGRAASRDPFADDESLA